VCTGEEFILIGARTFCSEDFPARSAFEQIAERLALAQKNMIDVVRVEKTQRILAMQNSDEILHDSMVFEGIPARIDEGWLGVEIHDAAQMLLIEGSPGRLNRRNGLQGVVCRQSFLKRVLSREI